MIKIYIEFYLICGIMNLVEMFVLFVVTILSTIIFTYFFKNILIKAGIGDNPIVSEHRHKKGTPTMGGIAFLFVIILLFAFYYKNSDILLLSFIMLAGGIVGLIDDLLGLKVKEIQKIVVNISDNILPVGRLNVKPNEEVRIATPKAKEEVTNLLNKGLVKVVGEVPIKYEPEESHKIIIQIFLGVVFALTVSITSLANFYLGILAFPIIVIGILGCINTVNLIDGLDGLAAGILAIASISCCAYGLIIGNLDVLPPFIIIAGLCLGFLVFNKHPASIFMGDTGSFILGTGFAAAVVLTDIPYFGLLALGVPIFSVIVSLIYRAKIIKLPTEPLHHALSFYGWSETKIVLTYWGFTLLLCIIGLLIQMFLF